MSSSFEQRLTLEQIAELKEAFSLVDKEGQGTIFTKDLHHALGLLGFKATEAELQDMINETDVNKTGMISFDDFMGLIIRRGESKCDTEEEVLEAFRVFDKDGSGLMSGEQIKKLLRSGTQEDIELNEMIEAMPVNEEGLINYVDFVKEMMSKSSA